LYQCLCDLSVNKESNDARRCVLKDQETDDERERKQDMKKILAKRERNREIETEKSIALEKRAK
jgi:hypothetical protein